MTNVQTNYLSFLPLVSRVADDARVFPIVGMIDFTLDTAFVLNLTAAVQSAQMAHGIQGCFIDGASAVYGPMQMQVFGTGQLISVPAGVQGYFPLLCTPNTYTFTFVCSGAIGKPAGQGTWNVFMTNIPTVASAWGALSSGAGYGN